MSLHVENETHWRTPDIKRLVGVCLDAADVDPDRKRKVTVVYNKKRRKAVSVVDFEIEIRKKDTLLTIMLPKNGPKDPHSNGMIAIASAVAAPGPGELLAPSQTFWMAHYLAKEFALEPGALLIEVECDEDTRVTNRERFNELRRACGSDMPPVWANAADLLICKVIDPKKDGTYLAFIDKKERAIKRAENAIKKEEKAVVSANRRLKDAKERKKKAIKALKDAEERRA